ncbi:hypothetical protein TNIN_396201 [Trichonephila inaurata madagascariensis]|uniref:Uncharacterized protein n=1 Tax=Trichonephila inaurata madagascariensis TaxID=2747483 RepID=A0A8X6X6V9_9ARAC|nr:hypothetical protein TNIN_396201 [Trichonephila inaurata madagascariensis]
MHQVRCLQSFARRSQNQTNTTRKSFTKSSQSARTHKDTTRIANPNHSYRVQPLHCSSSEKPLRGKKAEIRVHTARRRFNWVLSGPKKKPFFRKSSQKSRDDRQQSHRGRSVTCGISRSIFVGTPGNI